MRLFTVTGSFFYGALDADLSQRIQNRNNEKPIFVGNIYPGKLIQNGISRKTVRKHVDFNYCGLRGICFDGQTFIGVKFDKSSLNDVSFKGATLKNVSFTPLFSLSKKYYSHQDH